MRISAFIFLLSFSANCQPEMKVSDIERALTKTIQDTAKYKKRTIIKVNDEGEIDTIRYYFETKELKFIYHYRFQGAYSYGEGPPYADIHVLKKLLFINGNLSYMSVNKIDEYYLNYKKGAKTTVECETTYFSKGVCFKYFAPIKIEGNSAIIKTLYKSKSSDEQDCIYCPYNEETVKQYLDLL